MWEREGESVEKSEVSDLVFVWMLILYVVVKFLIW
jgi:hypothetical protein